MSDPSTSASRLAPIRDTLGELVPVVRRAAALDPHAIARIRVDASTATVFVLLPFRILVSRTVSASAAGTELDTTVDCGEFIAWYDTERRDEPPPRDAQWRAGLPPRGGWRRIEAVPDDIVRTLVRKGALALKDAAEREGVPGAQPRAELTDALLDSVVLTATAEDGNTAEVSLRALSALTRMGFLPRESRIVISIAGRWTRVAAEYGSVYLERPGLGLNLSAG